MYDATITCLCNDMFKVVCAQFLWILRDALRPIVYVCASGLKQQQLLRTVAGVKRVSAEQLMNSSLLILCVHPPSHYHINTIYYFIPLIDF